MRRAAFLPLAVLATLGALLAPAPVTSGTVAETPVEVAAFLNQDRVRPGDLFQVAVVFKIGKGWHVYAPDETDPNYTRLSVTLPRASGFGWEAPRYPSSHEVALFGQTGRIYENEARVFFNGRADDRLSPGEQELRLLVDYQACTDEVCDQPRKGVPVALRIPVAARGDTVSPANVELFQDQPATLERKSAFAAALEKSVWAAILVLLVGGILTAFTPCVLPMIPFTVAFFTNQVDRSKVKTLTLALLYAAGIVTMFSVLGYAFGRAGSSAGALLGHPWVLLAFAAIFAALGLACFGLFELTVPSSLLSKLGGGSREGRLGAFLMGLLLGVVAAPCVGPVLAGLLVFIAAKGSGLSGLFYMFVFGLGLGLPFIALAFASGAIPKAGPWMVWVKDMFGVLLFAAALYFVDIVLQSPRTILLLAALGVVLLALRYLLPIIRRTESEHRSMSLGVVALLLATYLFAGPVVTRAFGIPSAESIVFRESWLPWRTDHDAALADARREGRPALVDFTAKWCVSCKEMVHMMERPEVWAELQRFILIKVDCTRSGGPGEALRDERYPELGVVPSIVIYDSLGNKVFSRKGEMKRDEFLETIRAVDGKLAKKPDSSEN
jgi:thiol:disulfide interchange protein DsbD